MIKNQIRYVKYDNKKNQIGYYVKYDKKSDQI